jgi:beta-lactam-binding protein with PASTA domain
LVPAGNEAGLSGIVVTVEPKPGSEIRPGDIVELGISSLQPLKQVPLLTGSVLSEAVLELESRNIIYEVIYIEPDYSFQKDEILQQWPREGIYLSEGSPVLLFVGR